MTLDELREIVDRMSHLSGDMKLVQRDKETGRLLDFYIEPELVFRDEKMKISIDENDEHVVLIWGGIE